MRTGRGWRAWVVASAAVALVLAGCGGGGRRASSSEGGRLEVVAAFEPLAEAAERVGGDAVHVENLTPAGVEPHDLELRPSQVDAVVDADLVVYLGRGFQPAVAKLAERRDDGSLDVLRGLDLPASARNDPHVWLDPTLQADIGDAVADALAAADPSRASTFRANAAAYRTGLEALDREIADGLAHCERHDVVTAHAAFSYLARRYGLTQVPVTGLSPSAEPDAARLAELAETIKDRNVTTVFAEELVSPEVAEALGREAGVRVDVLNPLEGLTKDEVAASADYGSVMRANLAALRKALSCT